MPESLIIKGSNGERYLSGKVTVSGAKNEALKVMPAALLYSGGLRIERVPDIEDIKRMRDILIDIGAHIRDEGSETITVVPDERVSIELPKDRMAEIRGSIVAVGPLLARFGEAIFYQPGGCLIGKRPIDVFLDGFRAFGADVIETACGESTRYHISARGEKLKGTRIVLRVPSVTATETFLLAALGADGTTVIHNAALEPEVHALALFLKESGGRIEGIGTHTLSITGGGMLSAPRAYKIMPDRIETGTFAIIGALAGKDMTIAACEPEHLCVPLALLERAGVRMDIGVDTIRFRGASMPSSDALTVKTQGYPGFPTDLQPLLAVFMTQTKGENSLFETIFESRLEYLPELRRMGADITATADHACIRGVTALSGIETPARDLRSGMAFIAAGLIARGETIVHNAYNIDRGYASIETRLAALGADIKRRSDG